MHRLCLSERQCLRETSSKIVTISLTVTTRLIIVTISLSETRLWKYISLIIMIVTMR